MHVYIQLYVERERDIDRYTHTSLSMCPHRNFQTRHGVADLSAMVCFTNAMTAWRRAWAELMQESRLTDLPTFWKPILKIPIGDLPNYNKA